MRSQFIGKLEVVLLVFLVGSLVAFYLTAQDWARMAHPWAVGDWLISYQSGFVRRGSIGTAIFGLNDLTGLSLATLVFGFHLLLFTILAAALGYFCLTKRLSLPVLLLLLSPAGLLFPILDLAGGGGRKEMLHFGLLAVWCIVLSRASCLNWRLIALFAGLVALATTAHEMLLFLSVFYSAAFAARSRQLGLDISVYKMCAIPAAALFFSGFIFLYGTGSAAVSPEELCRAIVERGLPVSACGGAIVYPSGLMVNLQDTWGKILTAWQYVNFMPHLLLLSFLPLALIASETRGAVGKTRDVLWLGIVAALPLFAMALDWGRWIHIIIVSSLLLMMVIAPNKSEPSEALPVESLDRLRPVWLTVLAMSYMLAWSLPHCCTPQFSKSALVRLIEALS